MRLVSDRGNTLDPYGAAVLSRVYFLPPTAVSKSARSRPQIRWTAPSRLPRRLGLAGLPPRTPTNDASAQSPDALVAALEVAARRTRLAAWRSAPIPDGIELLIKVAARKASAPMELGADPHYVCAAAIYYLEKVLWEGSDPYRALGLNKPSSPAETAARLWAFMDWLQPYIGTNHPEARFADRVLDAWDIVHASEARARSPWATFIHGAWARRLNLRPRG
jgi:hypothetical protein